MITPMIMVEHPRRKRELLFTIGRNVLPVKQPFTLTYGLEREDGTLEPAEVYLVDLAMLTYREQAAMLAMVAAKHGGTVEQVELEIERNGGLPILAEGSVLMPYGQFIFSN